MLYNLGQEAKKSDNGAGPLAVFFLKVCTRCIVTCDQKEKHHEQLVAKIFPFVEDGLSSKSSFEWWKTMIMIGSALCIEKVKYMFSPNRTWQVS